MNSNLKNGAVRSCNATATVIEGIWNAVKKFFITIKNFFVTCIQMQRVIILTLLSLLALMPIVVLAFYLASLSPSWEEIKDFVVLTVNGFIANHTAIQAIGTALLGIACLSLYATTLDWLNIVLTTTCKNKWEDAKAILIAKADYVFATCNYLQWQAVKLILGVAIAYFVWMMLSQTLPA